MRVGDLRDRVTIKTLAATTSATGAFTEAFTTTLATVWAQVHDASGDERYRGMQQEMASVYEVTIRYRSDVTAKDRITLPANWGNKVVRITSLRPLDDGKKRFLLITGSVISEAA